MKINDHCSYILLLIKLNFYNPNMKIRYPRGFNFSDTNFSNRVTIAQIELNKNYAKSS